MDGDGLSNREEYLLGTRPDLADSDGDGVSDFDEIRLHSDPLRMDVSFSPVASLTGDAYTASFGEWEKFGHAAHQRCRRGSVTWPLTVPASGVHAVRFTISAEYDGARNDQHDFIISLDDKPVSYQTITIPDNGTSTLAVLTPWLSAPGTHQLTLFVDNSFTEVPLSPGTPATLIFGFENNAFSQSATVQWQPTNIEFEDNLVIREGDSLLLTAFDEAAKASHERYAITINGHTFTDTADRPAPVAFDTPGT